MTLPPPRFLLALFLRVWAAIAAGVILLSAVFLIPAEAMEGNVIKSAERLSREGTYPALYKWCSSTLDNSTDSLMILTASHQNDQESIVEQAMQVYRLRSENGAHFSLVERYVNGNDGLERGNYPRYWHGYLIWLKPALCLMDYQTLRYANGAVQSVLLMALVFLMFRKNMKAYIIPVATAAGMLMPILLAKSLQCSSSYYMMLFGCLAVVAMKNRIKEKEAFIFLYIGIGAAFFDLLTYPVATVGVPAVLCFVISNGSRVWEDVKRLFKICFCWCFGYGGMWSGKWLIGSILTGEDFFTAALQTASARTSSNNLDRFGVSGAEAVFYAWQRNWKEFWRTPVIWMVCAVIIISLAVFLFRVARHKNCVEALRCVPIMTVIACMPFVWYAVLTNHSVIHISLAGKALVVIPFAAMCLCVKLALETKRPYQ